MYKFWIFTVDTNVKFPEPVYYFKYKGLEFKYITRYKEGKADNIVIRYSNMSDDNAYALVAEYLNALAFSRYDFVHFESIFRMQNSAKLSQVNYLSDKVRSYDCHDVVSDIYFISNITNEEQSHLISLYRQAQCNENECFKALFFWHTLVYPNSDESLAVNFINRNIDKAYDLQVNHIKNNPIFSKDGKINTTIGDYIKNGVRHSIAHIIRDKKDAVSLKMENWEQVQHIATIASILKDISRYRIENEFGVTGYPSPETLNHFDPDES